MDPETTLHDMTPDQPSATAADALSELEQARRAAGTAAARESAARDTFRRYRRDMMTVISGVLLFLVIVTFIWGKGNYLPCYPVVAVFWALLGVDCLNRYRQSRRKALLIALLLLLAAALASLLLFVVALLP